MEDVAMDASDISAKPKTSILDLNEDCLTEISQYLDFEDLTMFFKTHEHFHNSIERVVASKIFTFEICEYEYGCCCYDDMKGILKFLIPFGKQLQGLKLKVPAHYDHYQYKRIASLMKSNIETLIETCCAKGNIKHLVLENFYFSKEFIRDNDVFIDSLRSIEIDSKRDWFKDFVSKLRNVKRLKIKTKSTHDINEYLKRINFRQLETLQLLGFSNRINCDELIISLSLKRLEIPNCDCDLSLLVNRFPNLEYLAFDEGNKTYSLEPLLKLSKLRHVSLGFHEKLIPEILKFVKLTEKLDYLTLSLPEDNVNVPQFYEELDKIRCNQSGQKLLHVILLVQPIFYSKLSGLNFQGKYVTSSCRNSESESKQDSNCYEDYCGVCNDLDEKGWNCY